MKIDPEYIYKLYLKHNLIPKTGCRVGDIKYCCALDILHLEITKKFAAWALSDWANNYYGFNFTTGFWRGFDGIVNYSSHRATRDVVRDEGYNNGVAVRNYLIEKGFSL